MTDKSQISIRALSIKPSLTLEISAKAKALKAEGKNICSLSAGNLISIPLNLLSMQL